VKRLLTFLLSILIPLLSLAGCGGHWGHQSSLDDLVTVPDESSDLLERGAEEDSLPSESDHAEYQLLATLESREEAEAVAELYGITLLKYQDSLAIFCTEENPWEVISRGEAKGWPELSLNDIQTIS